jgi:hypothetical protein
MIIFIYICFTTVTLETSMLHVHCTCMTITEDMLLIASHILGFPFDVTFLCEIPFSQNKSTMVYIYHNQGRIQRGAHPQRAPPKIGKNINFLRKIVIFHTKYPKNFRASLRNWRKYDYRREV